MADLAHLGDDLAKSRSLIANAAQFSPTNRSPLLTVLNQVNKAENELTTDLIKTWQAFVWLEYTILQADLRPLGIRLPDWIPSLSDQAPALSPPAPDHDLTIRPRSGPIIGDPPISATEGVPWYGQFSFSDSDSDGTNPNQYEIISGSIDWGDGNSTPFSVGVAEGGGSPYIDPNHTWIETGTYTVTITANDPDGGSSQLIETANVADGQLSWSTIGDTAPNYPPSWTQNIDAAPTITRPTSQINTEGDNVSLQIQAYNSDSDALSYEALGLPPGLSINSSTGLISGTVAYGAAADFDGSYDPTIIVTDTDGDSAQTSFAWTINYAQVAPVLTSLGNQTNSVGDSVSLQLSATQIDNNPIFYDATNLPPGLSIDPLTGLISGTVDSSATLGVPYAVTVMATDETTNLSASQNLNWTINDTNSAPALTTPGNQINSAGDNVSLQLSATDADGDALTYTATGLPPGLTLDPINGLISGTLPNTAASSTPYNVTLTSSDGMASNSQSFAWTVNAVSLQAPGDQSNLDGDSASLQLTASDANNATLTYSASNLPPGLSINSSTGLISGTISSTADTNSPYSTTVTATDSNSDSVSQSFNWTVTRLALNPVDDQENQEGTSVSLQLSAADNVATPTYSATGLPSGLSISSTGLISGTIGIGSFGSSPYQVTATATDGSYTSSQSFVWTVTPRVALVNPGSQSNAVGDSVSLQLSATSPSGTMTYSASGLPAGLSISNTGLISGSPTTASTTPNTVTVTANDGTSSSSQTLPWTISVINLVSSGDQTNNDGDAVSLSPTIGYHGSGTLSYSATGLPQGLSINAQTGQIRGTIAGTADTNSPYSVTLTVTDGTNTSSQTFNWTVNPVVSIDLINDQSNAVGDIVSLQITAGDAENKTLTYSATNLPTGLSISSSTGLISGTIAAGADGSSPYAVTVTATDSSGNSASQSFNWTVSHVSLVNPGSQSSIDGAIVSLQLQGKDADGDAVSYTASGLPSGLSINQSTGLISGTIASNADADSPYNVSVTASDGVHTTTQTFLWTASQVALTLPSNQTNTEGDTVSLQLQGNASSGTLVYNASGLPSGLSLNATTGLISGSIDAGSAANGPYTVDVSDTNGTVSTSQTFTWTVNPVVNLTTPVDQSNNEGDNVSLQISATDLLNKALTYSASGLPSGLSINSSTGLISGIISSGDSANSPYAVTVTASDSTYSSSVTFSWNITHTDTTALTMTNPGTQVNVGGDSIVLQINASDPDGDALTYSATGLPDGVDIDSATGAIAGTLTSEAVSTTPYSVTVAAEDGNGQSVSQTFNWIVNDATIKVQALPSINATEGVNTGTLTLATFTDPNPGRADGDYVATIDWGDGTSDPGVVDGADGIFNVYGDHAYAEKGNYTVTVSISDSNGETISAPIAATVAEAPMTLTGGFYLGDPMTDAQGGFQLATLTDTNLLAPASDFTVTINWGDGTIDTGAPYAYITSMADGVFIIGGSHNYPNPVPQQVGPVTYNVTVTVSDEGGASVSTTSTIVVGNIMAGLSATMGGWLFVDQNAYASASDFVANGQTGVALINWGDGTTSLGTIGSGSGNGGGGIEFPITATHTYAQDSLSQPNGQYQITVTVTDEDGNTLMGKQYVSVVPPPITVLASNDIETSAGNVNNALVGVFLSPGGTASNYSATINWGDGTTSSATSIVQKGIAFEVYGSHTYAQPQVEPVSIQVYWSDPDFGGEALAQAVPAAAPAKMDNLSAAVRNLIHQYGSGDKLVLLDIDKLIYNPKVQESDAAAVAVLKGYVLELVGKENKPASAANLFVKDLKGWSPLVQGITLDNVTYFENIFNGKAGDAPLQNGAKTLNTIFQNYVKRIEGTKRELWARREDWPDTKFYGGAWKSVSQGAEGDCAFLSVTIALVARDGKAFQERVKETGKKDGVMQYQVTFGDVKNNKNVQTVTVSSPTDTQIAYYSTAGAGGLWLSVREKACAQVFHDNTVFGWLSLFDYDSLRFGERLEDAMERVTGHKGRVYFLSQSKKGEDEKSIRNKIYNAAGNPAGHRLMVFDVNDKGDIAQTLGIKTAHAFGIVYANGKSGSNVIIRNPWNKGQSKYGSLFQLSYSDLYNYGRFLVIEDTK